MTDIILSKRLNAITEFVHNGSILADIGTDHGYLPVFLTMKKIVTTAYACDINEKPLLKAKDLIFSQNLQNSVFPLLSDGLSHLENKNINEIVIAGMGFDSIIEIISKSNWVFNENIHFILQPMSGCENVRRFLYENNFNINDETAVFENGKTYSILSVYYGRKNLLENRELFFYYGFHLFKQENSDSKKYIKKRIEKLKRILSNLEKSDIIKNKIKIENITHLLEITTSYDI